MRSCRALVVGLGLFAAAVGADEALDAQLADAVAEKKTGLVRELLEKGASVEAKGYWGSTPLVMAAETGDLATLNLLLGKGANLEVENNYGHAALAAGVKHRAVVERLLAAGAQVNRPNKEGVTPLMVAALESNREMVGLLLERGADPKARSANGEGVLWNALNHVSRGEGWAIFQMLLKAGAPIDTRSPGEPLFVTAVNGRQEEAARELLRRGADPWARRPDGMGALDLAVRDPATTEGMMRLLLSHRPSQATLDRAIHTAAEADNLQALLWLHKAGANLNSRNGDDTLLGTAVYSRAWVVSRELLRLGLSPNGVAAGGKSPLELAIDRHDSELARLLLRSGANPNARNADGEPVVTAVLLSEQADMLEMMIVAGLNKKTKVYGVSLQKQVVHSGDQKMLAAFNKAATPRAKQELGLANLDDDAQFRSLVGTWGDSDERITLTLNPDGTYTEKIRILGLSKSEEGVWSVAKGDLVVEARGSPGASVAKRHPIMSFAGDVMVLKGSERTVWKRTAKQ